MMIAISKQWLKDNPIVESRSSADLNAPAAVENPLEFSPQKLAERDESELSRSLVLACRCAEVAEQMKAGDIIVLDLTKITPEFDYFVIATGNSRRQLHAIAEEVDTMMAEAGSRRLGIEGYDNSAWILQDYGDIVLHAFDPKNRELYDLERLWGDAERIDWKAVLQSESPDKPNA